MLSKFASLSEMKDYVRKNKLNKSSIKLGMKKADMLSALDKLGHIHSGPRETVKKAPTPKAPEKAPEKAPTPNEDTEVKIGKPGLNHYYEYVKNPTLMFDRIVMYLGKVDIEATKGIQKRIKDLISKVLKLYGKVSSWSIPKLPAPKSKLFTIVVEGNTSYNNRSIRIK